MTQQDKSNGNSTHFGYQTVAKEDKAAKVAEVFHSVAGKYDVMNDLMSFGIHRVWKRYTIERAAARPGHKILDIAGGTGDLTAKFSKIVGAEGKVTLPLIVAMKNGNKWQTSLIRETIKSGGTENLGAIVSIVNDTGGINYTLASASSEKDKALASIQDISSSIYRSSMEKLVGFVLERPV